MTCWPYRKIIVKEVVGEDSEGRMIFADAEELELEAETGDCSKRQGRRSAAPSMPCVGEGQELTPV
jgi:hypothetical protein